MNQGVEVVGLYVRDQDEALAFYVEKIGFRVHTDVRNGDYRWLTVQHPDQPSFQLGLFKPGPPVLDAATAQTLNAIVAKGAMPPLVLDRRRLPRRLRPDARPRSGVHAGARRPLRHRGRRLPRSLGERMEDDRGTPLSGLHRRDSMNWKMWVRQIHRWLAIAFTVTVIANFVALAQGGGMPPPWVTYSPLLPLALLWLTGLYMFVLPYATKWRSGPRTV